MGEKRRLSLTEVLSDIERGLTDPELMEKHGLNAGQLGKVFAKLVESGRLTQAEVDARKGLPEDILELSGEFSNQVPLAPSSQESLLDDNRPLPPAPPCCDDSLPPPPQNWQKRATLGIIGGIVLEALGGVLSTLGKSAGPGDLMQILAILMVLGGLGVQVWGCYNLVKGKGYHGALSILGILCCAGLLILLLLPSKYDETKTSGAMIVLVVAVVGFVAIAIMGIILAIAIPYYVSFKRTGCDRAASADVAKLAAAFERLRNELADQDLKFDDDAIGRAADGNVLQYLVGPYYGFGGSTKKCGVLLRMSRQQGRWIVEGASVKASHPAGQTSRYVYRAPIDGGSDLPATIAKDLADAGNGKSLDWNSYPYAPIGRPEMCYTESVIQAEGSPGHRRFSVKIPKGVPCSVVKRK